MQRYDFMSNHVSFSNRFWVSILDPPHRVYRLRLKKRKTKFLYENIWWKRKNNSFELPIAVIWKQMLRYKNMCGITELYTVHDEF